MPSGNPKLKQKKQQQLEFSLWINVPEKVKSVKSLVARECREIEAYRSKFGAKWLKSSEGKKRSEGTTEQVGGSEDSNEKW